MSAKQSIESILDEIRMEYLSRRKQGDELSGSDLTERFPEHADAIRRMLKSLTDDAEQVTLTPVEVDSSRENEAHPQRIGPYRIIREIGRGGMGVVFEAEHQTLQRRVAIKILAQRLSADRLARARFHREARAIAGLHHTNIVPLFEAGEDSGRVYFVMQLIEGQSLDEWIEEDDQTGTIERSEQFINDQSTTDLDVVEPAKNSVEIHSCKLESTSDSVSTARVRQREIANIGIQVADALAYAHYRGIIHRDVKPSNLIIDANGLVWLTDFGLAKTDDEEVTQTGNFLGTLRYMSPERFEGHCDAASDVYSLGVTLYEFLTQRSAFGSSHRLNLMYLIQNSEPERLRRVRPEISRDLETIIHKAIEKEPSVRYPSAREFAADLRRFVADRPIRARRVTLGEQLYRWGRRNPLLATALSFVFLLLGVILVGSIIAASSFREQAMTEKILATKASKSEATVRELLRESEFREQQLERNLYVSQMNNASHLVTMPGGVNRVLAATEQWRPSPNSQDMRGWEWYYLRSMCNQEEAVVAGHDDRSWKVVWHPDGQRFATCGKGGVLVWNLEEKVPIETLPSDDFVADIAWSPDGLKLAYSIPSRQIIKIRDQVTGQTVQSFDCGQEWPLMIRWHRDSQMLLAGTRSGNVLLWSSSSGQLVREFGSESIVETSCLDWHPLRNQFISTDQRGRLYVWSIDSSQPEEELVVHDGNANVARFHPVGNQVLTGGEDYLVKIWDWKTRTVSWQSEEFGQIFTAEWSCDGSTFAVGGVRQEVTVLSSRQKRIMRKFAGHESVVWKMNWSPSGNRIASVDPGVGKIRIWNVDTNSFKRSMPTIGSVTALAWGADDSQIAIGCLDGKCFLQTKFLESPVTVIHTDQRKIASLAWSQDQEKIASWGFRKNVKVWDRTTLREDEKFSSHPPYGELFWDDSENLWQVAHFNRSIALTNHSQNETPWKLQALPDQILSLTYRPEIGLAFALANQEIQIWNIDQKAPNAVIQIDEAEPFKGRCLSWDPTGKRLAGSIRSTLCLWDRKSGVRLQKMVGHSSAIRSLDWHPWEERIATGANDRTVRIWDTSTGRQVASFEMKGTVDVVQWSHDGTMLAVGMNDESTGGGRVMILDANRALSEDKSPIHDVSDGHLNLTDNNDLAKTTY